MAENSTPPADWYADPADPTLQRWWDGEEWSTRLRPAAPLRAAPAGATASARGTHLATQERDEPASPIPRAVVPSRYFGDRFPPPIVLGTPEPHDIRDVYRQSRDIANVDPHRIVRNPAATVGIVAAILTAAGLAVFQQYGISFTYLFAPSVVVLAISGIAVGRARLTGAGVFRSVTALLIAGPLTIVTVWAFAQQLVAIVPFDL